MLESILQENKERCYLCGRRGTSVDPLDCHHVFFGPFRNNSEKYGLKVYIHHNSCHIFGENAIHRNVALCRELQEETQKTAMAYYGWSIKDFREIFGKNYIQENANTCVVCGAIIPEGRQVCPMCTQKAFTAKSR